MRTAITMAVALIAGCGDGSGHRFDLGDGTAVQVSSTGRVEVQAGGRTVATIPAEGVAVRTFAETYTAPLGIWEFDRENVDTASPTGCRR